MFEVDPEPPCLTDVFREGDTQPLANAVLKFNGLSNGTFGCGKRTCGQLGRLCFFPGYRVTEWPECPGSEDVDSTASPVQ